MRLSRREKQVILMIAKGKENKEIAYTLKLELNTIQCYVHQALFKLKVESRAEIAAWAIGRGWLNGWVRPVAGGGPA